MHEIGAAANVADSLNLGPLVTVVIAGAAGLAGKPAGNAVDEGGFVHLHQDYMVELPAVLGEHRVERLGLRHGARKAVENEALASVVLLEPLAYGVGAGR